MTRLLTLLILGFSALPAAAAGSTELSCTPQDKTYWIRSVRINVPSNKVWLQVQDDDHTHEMKLIHVGPEQFGARTYHFNWTVEGAADPVVNAFKLFRAMNEWRLIDVGMESRNGTLVLKALGASQIMDCK